MKPDYRYKAKLISIYDGDTITVDISLGFGTWLHKQKLRLYGINTPEIRTRDRKEKEAGYVARAFVMGALNPYHDKGVGYVPSDILVETYKGKKGSFGRWLAIVWYRKGGWIRFRNLNTELLRKGLAKPYTR